MRETKVLAALAAASVLVILATDSATAGSDRRPRGGFVVPCSLVGVNPVYHPDIFGNPAIAKAYYGFVRSRDGTWLVQSNCHIY